VGKGAGTATVRRPVESSALERFFLQGEKKRRRKRDEREVKRNIKGKVN